MTRRVHTAGNSEAWRFTARPQHASDRLKTHGRVLPMERPSLWARLWGKL